MAPGGPLDPPVVAGIHVPPMFQAMGEGYILYRPTKLPKERQDREHGSFRKVIHAQGASCGVGMYRRSEGQANLTDFLMKIERPLAIPCSKHGGHFIDGCPAVLFKGVSSGLRWFGEWLWRGTCGILGSHC